MYSITYTFTDPKFDILYFYSQIDNIVPDFNITYSPIDILTADTFIFTSDSQENLDNFISYLNGDTFNY